MIIVALTIFHVCTLANFPAPFIDEAWFIARARGFARNGYPFGALDAGVFDKLPGYHYFFPYLPTALQSLPFLITDEPSLTATRAISLVCGFALVYCVFIIGNWVSGTITGLLSAALVLSSDAFLISSHLARIDILAASVGMIGITLILTSSRVSYARLMLGGFLAVVAMEFHPHAAPITAPALAASLTVGLSLRERLCSSLLVSLGGGLGALVYAMLHIFPDPGAFIAFQKIAFAPSHTPPLFTSDAYVMMEGLNQALTTASGIDWSVGLISFILAVGGIALTRGRTRLIGILSVIAIIAFGLLIRHKFGYYKIYLTPLMLVFTASLIVHLFHEVHRWMNMHRICGRVVQACAILLCVPPSVGITMAVFEASRLPKANKVLPDLSRFVRPNDRILGTQTYWLAVPNITYHSPEHLIYYTRWKQGASVSDALNVLRPTLIVQDEHMRKVLKPRGRTCEYICFPDNGLDLLLASSEMIATIPSSTYGEIRIYRPRLAP